jgi:hypothetical protein
MTGQKREVFLCNLNYQRTSVQLDKHRSKMNSINFPPMKRRPLSVTLISYLFIAAGVVGIIYHASELKDLATPEVSLVLLVRMLAIIAGIFTLRGANWARWLLVAWIIYHVTLSFFHSSAEVIMHFVLAIVVIMSLFHPKANTYFRKK